MAGVEVFTVADARYFVGAVASAVTVGRSLPAAGITVLDLRLRPDQRAWLADRYRVVDPPARRHPYAAKSFVALHLDRLDPDGVAVVVDADLVATGPWDDYVASARAGALVAAIDPMADRHFDEWCTLLELPGPLHPRPYVNSGLVFWSIRHHGALLQRWMEVCARLGDAGGAEKFGVPGVFGDQDALNALLMTEFVDTEVDVRPASEVEISKAMHGIRIRDLASFTCTGPDGPLRALHSVVRPKPREPGTAWRVEGAAFARILRAAIGPAVASSPPVGPLAATEVVPWLRPGPVAGLRLAVVLAHARTRHAWGALRRALRTRRSV